MKLLYGVLLFAGVFALNNASVTLNRIATDKLLISNMLSARATNPNNVAPCFNYYLPIFNDILDEYETSYEACNTEANAQNALLELEAQGNQTLISEAAQSVCSSMTACSALDESLEFLDCYSSVGDGNIKSLYVLTNNATDVAASLREQKRVIENRLGVCQNASQRAYVENTNKANEDLNLCFENGVPTTPQPEEPSTLPPTEPSSEEPQEPSTEDPEAGPEEDLSRIAPPVAKLLSANKFNRLNRKYQH